MGLGTAASKWQRIKASIEYLEGGSLCERKEISISVLRNSNIRILKRRARLNYLLQGHIAEGRGRAAVEVTKEHVRRGTQFSTRQTSANTQFSTQCT